VCARELASTKSRCSFIAAAITEELAEKNLAIEGGFHMTGRRHGTFKGGTKRFGDI